jgi:glycosyltransferase involved in cell wall biosynthesis
MKIILLGAANNIHLIKIANNLVRHNDVTIITLPNHNKIIHNINSKIKIYELKYSGLIGYFLNKGNLIKIIKNINPNIINIHYASGYGFLSSFVKEYLKILTMWGSDIYFFPKRNLIFKWILKRNLNSCDYLISTSHCMAQEASLYTNKVIEVIPFGVNTKLFYPNEQKNLDVPIIIGSIKNFKKIYGVKYLIEGFAEALQMVDDPLRKSLELHLYGKGKDEKYLKKLTTKFKIENKVKFKGYVANEKLPDIINSFSIFCISSIWESFGVSLLEGMSCGKPLIATNVPGFNEITKNISHICTIPTKDSGSIRDSIIHLLQNQALWKDIGNESRNRILNFYDEELCNKKLEHFFEKLIIHN